MSGHLSKSLSLLPVVLAFLAACEATNFHNADVEGLIDAYRAKNAAQTEAIAHVPGVQVTTSGKASEIRLSAAYDRAPVYHFWDWITSPAMSVLIAIMYVLFMQCAGWLQVIYANCRSKEAAVTSTTTTTTTVEVSVQQKTVTTVAAAEAEV